MRNIWLLTKNYFNCGLGSLFGKKKRIKSITGIIIIVVLIALLMGLLGFSAWVIGLVATSLDVAEHGFTLEYLLSQGYSTALMVVILLALQKVTGGQRARDTDLLLSMPFTKTQIVVGKAAARYFFNLALTLMFTLPYSGMYIYFAGFPAEAIIGVVIITLLIPFLSLGLSYIIDFVTIVLFRNAPIGNILKALFTLAVIIVFVIFISGEDMLTLGPVLWLIDFTVSLDLAALLKILCMTVPVAVLGMVLFATTFDRQNQIAKGKKVEITAQPNKGVVASLFKKELSKYVNTPIYMINTLVGSIGIIGITIWVLIDKGVALSKFAVSLGLPIGSVAYAIIIVFCFFSAMTYASSCAISLEGKSLWILKTMPIKTRVVLLSKVLMNILLLTPLALVGGIAIFFTVEMTAVQFMLLLALPILVNIIISFGGLLINLIYPKLDWESEAAVVKQSMSVIVTTLAGLVVGIVPVILALIMGFDKFETIGFLTLGIYVVLTAATVSLLMTLGKRLYERL